MSSKLTEEVINVRENEVISFGKAVVRSFAEPVTGRISEDFLGKDHPAQFVIEGLLADSNDFVRKYGRDVALYLTGYLDAHIERCRPCNGKANTEHYKYIA